MSSDIHLEQEEERVREAQAREQLWEQAVEVVVNKTPRTDAARVVVAREAERVNADVRDQVIRDEDGHAVDFFDASLDRRLPSGVSLKQVNAVYWSLCEKAGISPKSEIKNA